MRPAIALMLASVSLLVFAGQAPQSIAPRTVVIPSGDLRLKALLWTPPGSGPFPAVLFNHGRSDDGAHTGGVEFAAAAQILGPIFLKHGYAFLYPCRRGEGLSSDQGTFIGELLSREEAAKGEEARRHLQLVLMNTDHLDDVTAGLSFLKALPGIDPHRIAVAGHSFGGQLTLLTAERDHTIRAAITFAAAANSWEGSSELRQRLLVAIRKISVPVMLVQSMKDYSLTPGQSMAAELLRLGKTHQFKIYPSVGLTSNDGHNAVYIAPDQWEEDVFKFLDMYVKQ